MSSDTNSVADGSGGTVPENNDDDGGDNDSDGDGADEKLPAYVRLSGREQHLLRAIRTLECEEPGCIRSAGVVCDQLNEWGIDATKRGVLETLSKLADRGHIRQERVSANDDRRESRGTRPREHSLDEDFEALEREAVRWRLDKSKFGPENVFTIDEVAQADYATRSGGDDDDSRGGMSPEQIRQIIRGGL